MRRFFEVMRTMQSPLPHQQAIQRQIGDVLRRCYEPMVREPLPDNFLKLIEDLEASRRAKETAPNGLVEGLGQRLRSELPA